jgi:lysophospholipase L1-like esterase
MPRLDRLMVGVLALMLLSPAVFGRDEGNWIGTWGTSPVGLPPVINTVGHTRPSPIIPITVKGTIRYRLRVSLGGSQIRLRFSNEYGDTPLSLQAVTIGLAADGLDALPGSLTQVAFSKKGSVTLPVQTAAVSDSVNLAVKDLGDLVVSVYVPEGVGTYSWRTPPFGPFAGVVEGSDATRAEHLSASKSLPIRPIVSEIDVRTDRPQKVVVALGDSITDGDIDVSTGERGWPDALARRLQPKGIAVVNAGIGGNRLLQSTPMFGGPGGRNGDAQLVDPKALIATYSAIIQRAHEHGVKVFGGTIMPFEGADYYSTEKERVRQAINEWIRTAKAFDAVIDFDKIVRDPVASHKMGTEYDSGDHLHPSTDGYRKIGESIDLQPFH